MTKSSLPQLVRIQKALAHPVRLRIVAMLRQGPLCVCQITAVLELAASTVSAHLSELRRVDVVTERKDGKWVEYRLVEEPRMPGIVSSVLSELEKDPAVVRDRALVRELRKVSLEELCRVDLDLSKLAIRLPTRTPSPRTAALG